MMSGIKHSLGLDFGTNSCRALIVELSTGRELSTHVCNYPSGHLGIITSEGDPNLARQHPADHLYSLENSIIGAIEKARDRHSDFDPYSIIAIGIDTTGSTVIPVDSSGTPLALLPQFEKDPAAMAWLWKDHTSHAEAAEITDLAASMRPRYLEFSGGKYSSEWFWAKILHLKRTSPAVYDAAYTFVELCDWIPALLSGSGDPTQWRRSLCTAGHKAIFNESWGGLPDDDFLSLLNPAFPALRRRLYNCAYPADTAAGTICREWARRLGLSPATIIAVGALDAHLGAVGAGITPGRLIAILGTSACYIAVADNTAGFTAIPDICSSAPHSVVPGYLGMEASQPAAGDIFLWFVNNLVPDSYGASQSEKLENLALAAAKLIPGESGLLALEWNNGTRAPLADDRLSGLILGQTLHTTAPEIYRALIEATAFGARKIIGHLQRCGLKFHEIVASGGLATKNPLLMQIYSDIFELPISIAGSDQSGALGAAIMASVAAGHFPDVPTAQSKLCRLCPITYSPKPTDSAIYRSLYKLYSQLHSSFGMPATQATLYNVMKDLIELRTNKAR